MSLNKAYNLNERQQLFAVGRNAVQDLGQGWSVVPFWKLFGVPRTGSNRVPVIVNNEHNVQIIMTPMYGTFSLRCINKDQVGQPCNNLSFDDLKYKIIELAIEALAGIEVPQVAMTPMDWRLHDAGSCYQKIHSWGYPQ